MWNTIKPRNHMAQTIGGGGGGGKNLYSPHPSQNIEGYHTPPPSPSPGFAPLLSSH